MAKDDIDIGRLCQAIYHARLALRYPRQERFNAVRQYVGKHWSEEGASKEVPLNLIGAYVSIVGRKLIAHNPRVLLSTWNKKAKPTVKTMEDWANQEIEDLNLANTLQRIVIDALFSVGIAKVSLATPADAALAGWNLKAGEPCCERIDLDDFVFDHHARDFSEVSFIGHRFRAPLDVIKSSKIYSKDRKELVAEPDKIYNLEGDERIGMLGRTTVGGEEEFEDYVDLWEIYLPRHRVVVTLCEDQLTSSMTSEGKLDKSYGKALRIQKWLGPDSGPYHILGFGVVPGNTMPKAPIQDLIDLHEAVNRILRKLIRQADRQKELTGVKYGTEDGDRIMNANDGDIVRSNDPAGITPFKSGGVDQALFQFFLAMKELFSWLSGNLDIMGGLSPQAKTAHQDAMLNQNSTATVGEMQQRTVDFSACVVESLCWYWHHDPSTVQKSEFSLPGLPGISSMRRVFPNHPKHFDPRHPEFRRKKAMVRSHAFEHMKIQVDPYSMQHQTPQERLAALNQVVAQIYLPMAQMAKEQGINLDLNAYFTKIGKLTDDPDLQDLLTIQEPPAPDAAGAGGGGDSGPGKPTQTSREYVRRSVGGTPQGKQQDLMQQLAAGMGQQNGQAKRPGAQ